MWMWMWQHTGESHMCLKLRSYAATAVHSARCSAKPVGDHMSLCSVAASAWDSWLLCRLATMYGSQLCAAELYGLRLNAVMFAAVWCCVFLCCMYLKGSVC